MNTAAELDPEFAMAAASEKRQLLFIACILFRACITGGALWLALKEEHAVPILGAIALVVGIGFTAAHFWGSDAGFFGGEAWWHELRKVHALLWLATGATMVAGLSWGAAFAVGDTVLGMVAGFMKYGLKVI